MDQAHNTVALPFPENSNDGNVEFQQLELKVARAHGHHAAHPTRWTGVGPFGALPPLWHLGPSVSDGNGSRDDEPIAMISMPPLHVDGFGGFTKAFAE